MQRSLLTEQGHNLRLVSSTITRTYNQNRYYLPLSPAISPSATVLPNRMSDEAFPNSDELFKQAFSSPEPLSPLLELLKKHPTYYSVRDLIIAYTETVAAKPLRGQILASALSQLGRSADAPQITGVADPLSALINRELADLHFKSPELEDGPHTWGPDNQYLIESLLSALSLKLDLTSSSDMLAPLGDGLNATPSTPHAQEVVVGACVQLLMAGSFFVSNQAGFYRTTPEKVAAKLRSQKDLGTVREESGIRALELAIVHAEKGFQATDELENAFVLLFPSNA